MKRFLSCMALFPLLCMAPVAMAKDLTWFRGDLHAHSLHSDGDSPVADVVTTAESLGLDFFALTDHDSHMNGIPTHWSDPDYRSDSVTLLYGVEWTTGKGHANVLAAAPFDYSPLWEAHQKQDPSAAIAAAHKEKALFSINHPTAYFCCPWEYPVDASVDAMEVWNAMYLLPNFNGIAVNSAWDTALLSGRKLPCVGGSDTHELKGFQSRLFSLGNPTTWVCAEDASAPSILDAIRAGRTSLSYAPDGPRIDFTADRNADGIFETMIGDNINADSSAAIFKIAIQEKENGSPSSATPLDLPTLHRLLDGSFWTDPSLTPLENPRLVAVIKNGTLYKAWLVTGNTPRITFTETPGDLDYYRVVLYGRPDQTGPLLTLLYGQLLALTGPIYSGFHSDDAYGEMNMYFGNLHSHTAVSDGKGTPEEALIWARDTAGYDFYAITDHAEQILPSEWEETGNKADAFTEDGEFVAFRGFEWSHPLAGHINVFNTKTYTSSILTPTLGTFYFWLHQKNGLAQFNHPGREALVFRDFLYYPFVADNFFAIETGNKGTGNTDGEYLAYYPEALSRGWRVAPSNNQDNHSLSTNSHRTVIIAPALTRSHLLSAMKKRRIYSTDDPNIKVVFKCQDKWMGSFVSTTAETVPLTIDIADDEIIQKITVKNAAGEIIAEKIPDLPTKKLRWCPVIAAENNAYYVRITSENRHDNPDTEPTQVTVTAPITLH